MTDDLYQTIGGNSESDDDSLSRLTPGTVLGGDYELVRQLGRGGMGVVWEAKELAADRLVALKFVPRDLQRFEAEMQRVRQTFTKVHALQHQHICPLYGLKSDLQLGHYLVMKWLTGESLDTYLMRIDPEKKGISTQQALAILKPVAAALDYAHKQKIIHRDIKPSNIFLVLRENIADIQDVQVIDFGLAGEIKASLGRVSQAAIDTSGTRLYMAPEQWRGRQQTAATDQYALAVVAYEMLAGHLPFEGGDLELLRMAIMQDKPDSITKIPPAANGVLQKGLAKDMVDRFADCTMLVNSLAASFGFATSQTQNRPVPPNQARQAQPVSPLQINIPHEIPKEWKDRFRTWVEKYRDIFSPKKASIPKPPNMLKIGCLSGCGCLMLVFFMFLLIGWSTTSVMKIENFGSPKPSDYDFTTDSGTQTQNLWQTPSLRFEGTGANPSSGLQDSVTLTLRQKVDTKRVREGANLYEGESGISLTWDQATYSYTCEGRFAGSGLTGLYGRFEMKSPEYTTTASQETIELQGTLSLGGDDGSNYPKRITARYDMTLNIDHNLKMAEGTFCVHPIPGVWSAPQYGVLSLTMQ